MLGLADRGRVLDLFEKVMGGKIADALADLNNLYDHGADPLAVMQDLLEIVHFLTRVKVAPGAEGFFDGGSGEARRAAEMAGKLSVPSLTRAWQVLLKGLLEVRDATRPVAACEMALIRLSYAADLPPTDKLVRDLLDNPTLAGWSESAKRRQPPANPVRAKGPVATARARQAKARSERPGHATRTDHVHCARPCRSAQASKISLALLAQPTSSLKVNLEHNVHLVRMEQDGLHRNRASTAKAPRHARRRPVAKTAQSHRPALVGFHRPRGWGADAGRAQELRQGREIRKRRAGAAGPSRAGPLPSAPRSCDRAQRIADEDITLAMPDDES